MLERGRNQAQGSSGDFVCNILAREQMKTATRFGQPQFAVTAGLLEVIKEKGGDKTKLSIQVVVQAIRKAYLTVNNQPVGKIVEKT